MESRKAWRNREPSAGEGVLALLEAFRDALGAQGVGLFDDDRGDPRGQVSPPNFWQAFEEADGACATIDWARFYEELRRDERVETLCGCGRRHQLYGFLLHGRWALLLIAPPVLPPDAAVAIASSVRALSEKLPPALPPERARPDAAPASGQLWWVGKTRH
jgi:hypothetical protein